MSLNFHYEKDELIPGDSENKYIHAGLVAFFDNVPCGDFRKYENPCVHFGDFRNFFHEIRKYGILKSPECAAQSGDFGHTLLPSWFTSHQYRTA